MYNIGIDQNIEWYMKAVLKSKFKALNIARVIPHPTHSIPKKCLNMQGVFKNQSITKIITYKNVRKSLFFNSFIFLIIKSISL